jgi:3,4-dihydroxy 2-butanone 4-phosphate synthase
VTHLPAALAALQSGKPVLLYDADGREEETDIVLPAGAATPDMVRMMRQDAGGLLCVTVSPEHHHKLGLPFLADTFAGMSAKHPVLAEMRANDVRYDASKPAFGIPINARATFTGITDQDRSLTITTLAAFLRKMTKLTPDDARSEFGHLFRAPGHVHLLNGHAQGLAARQGHTELSTELMRQAGLLPSAVLCEMLDGKTGRALGKKDAMAYAKQHGLVFLTGQDVVSAWQAKSVPTSA